MILSFIQNSFSKNLRGRIGTVTITVSKNS